ncbi:MAG: hypothetical protein GWP04_07305 [Gammaproteobacteria bacterium]|nr:hypothetical protein [Gammaproteobacteria bacterium]
MDTTTLPRRPALPIRLWGRYVTGETIATGAAGAVLGGATLSPIGLGVPGAIVGGLNGVISGKRRIYDWRRPSGWAAFVLDSTWGLIGSGSGLGVHALQHLRRDRGGYRADLSARKGRHVYETGVTMRKGFTMTAGNTVTNLGKGQARIDLLERHEMLHVWQSRLFGPLFPAIYGLWMIGGAVVGAALALRRGDALRQTIDTIAYYDNPFEYWAYRRQGVWPPANAHTRYVWGGRTTMHASPLSLE